MTIKEQWIEFIQQLQNTICAAVEQADGKASFLEDDWQRAEGGGGRTRIISKGDVFEKGGVNTSIVFGPVTPAMRTQLNITGDNWFAAGISLVLHPENPFVPTVHANYRMFELYNAAGEVIDRWFGGGTDLTPYYLVEEDAVHFHGTYKNACDKFDNTFYDRFKQQCDDYFVNWHRNNERRGIGGIFYDYQRPQNDRGPQFWLDFAKTCGYAFLDAYLPIVAKRKNNRFTEDQKHWQQVRRGRYVEFNLVHDRGTVFGLKTNGRTESILMSLPPSAAFEYNYQPVAGSAEDELLQVCLHPRNWLSNQTTEEDKLMWAQQTNRC